jgi:hypothetical protein
MAAFRSFVRDVLLLVAFGLVGYVTLLVLALWGYYYEGWQMTRRRYRANGVKPMRKAWAGLAVQVAGLGAAGMAIALHPHRLAIALAAAGGAAAFFFGEKLKADYLK